MQVSETLSPSMSVSFKDFLFKEKGNRLILLIYLGLIIIQVSIFKYLYPFASFIHLESFSYIQAASQNLSIDFYPIGYSGFLRLFSVFSDSDTILVVFQYLCIHVSILFLLFTIFYFYKPGKVVQYILLGIMALNPLLWHLANLVSPDCLFTSLSIIWFALLLWIVHRPSTKIIIWHALVLFIAFIFRSHAIIYPFIGIVAFGLSQLSLRKKVVGAFAGILLCGLFICYTGYKHKHLTGYWQFSPFSGWLMANNAMYTYRYVDRADRKPVPKKFQALDNMIREYFDSARDVRIYPAEAKKAGTSYMRASYMSLSKYQKKLFENVNDSTVEEFKKWASMGPFFKQYGLYIIKQYPWYFAQYYVWPNTQNYFMPPVDILENYNSGSSVVTQEASIWFGYTSTKVRTNVAYGKVLILGFYPIICGAINLVMLVGLIYYLLLKGWKNNRVFRKIIIIGFAVWLLDAVFSISTSSASLRLQSFPLLVAFILALLLVDWMVQLLRSMKQIARFSEHNTQEMGCKIPQTIV